MGGWYRLQTIPTERSNRMGDDDKNTEDLRDASGGPDTVAPGITDALKDVDGGSVNGLVLQESDPLEDVVGGPINSGGPWTGT
jgi:hypothetical protein